MKKRVDLSSEEKAKLIADRESRANVEALQAKYGLKKTAIYALLSNKEDALEQACYSSPTTKRRRIASDEMLESVVLSWFKA